ncbi:MAG: DMT family transporter [Alphaproteobacteria bacterium]|nr:DMT family transporter [Alphaproteobacteria bacterium]
MNLSAPFSATAIGVLCGAGAAVCWAAGFVAARHGVDIGFTPADLTFHRCFWAGVVLMPLALRGGLLDLNGIGWSRGIVLTFFGGIGLSFVSYSGFLLVPLGHGGIIQPATAALLGLVLSTVVLNERLPPRRAAGAAVIVAGLIVIGGEAITTIGIHGIAGDLLFVLAGAFFAIFGMFLRKWRVPPTRAMIAISVVSLAILPIYGLVVGFGRMAALGLWENLLQAVMQGLLAGPGAIYLFTRAVVLLGAGRAAVFTTLVPPCVLLIGWVALGIVPSLPQFAGLGVVLLGFRLTQRA